MNYGSIDLKAKRFGFIKKIIVKIFGTKCVSIEDGYSIEIYRLRGKFYITREVSND